MIRILNSFNDKFVSKNIVICTGGNIKNFTKEKIKRSLAPIGIVKNVPENTELFVELDYLKKKCINLITKGSSYGMIGGISLSNSKDVDKYFEYMIKEHRKANPNIKILKKYVAIKNEIIYKHALKKFQ